MTQALLNLRARPKVGKDDVDRLIGWLCNGQETVPMRASVLARSLLGGQTENHKRIIREMASASTGRVIGTQEGYLLTEKATSEQITAWLAGQRAQIKTTQDRIDEVLAVRASTKTK